MPKQGRAARPLQRQLLELYDEFTEFNSCCAFFCDAVSALGVANGDWPDATSAEGLAFHSQWLKERSARLKEDLSVIRDNVAPGS